MLFFGLDVVFEEQVFFKQFLNRIVWLVMGLLIMLLIMLLQVYQGKGKSKI